MLELNYVVNLVNRVDMSSGPDTWNSKISVDIKFLVSDLRGVTDKKN